MHDHDTETLAEIYRRWAAEDRHLMDMHIERQKYEQRGLIYRHWEHCGCERAESQKRRAARLAELGKEDAA